MRRRVLTLVIVASSLVLPATAHAATGVPLPMADFLGIGKALLGGLEFTADKFRDLFLAMFGGLADMLIPNSWAKKGTEFLTWLVAVPNFTKPAFDGLKHLSGISLWIGLAMLPVTLGVSLGLPSLGLTSASDTPGAIFGRTVGAAVGLILYSTIWSQGAAICNQLSAAYITDPLAVKGMNAYMELIAVGGMLGGIPILGILIVLFAGAVFLAALVLKVFLVLIGALLFVTGPLLLGLIPTHRGAQLARTWVTALLATWAVPIVWGIVFVVSGVLIHHAPAIGVAIGGKGSIASTGGMLVAGCAAIAGPMLNAGLTKSVLGPLGAQLGSMTSAVAPGRLTQRLGTGAGAAAGRLGSIGGGPRPMTSTTSPAGGPVGVMQRLAAARLGAVQAARTGAASALPGGGANPIGSARGVASTAARGGLLGVAGAGVGRGIGHAQTAVAGYGGKTGTAKAAFNGTRARVAGETGSVGQDSAAPQTPTHAHNAAAVMAMRPQSSNGPATAAAPSPDGRRAPNPRPTDVPSGAGGADRPSAPGAPAAPAGRTAETRPVNPPVSLRRPHPTVKGGTDDMNRVKGAPIPTRGARTPRARNTSQGAARAARSTRSSGQLPRADRPTRRSPKKEQ